jgi:hypothetical protein
MIASNGMFGVTLDGSTVYVVNKNEAARIRKAVSIYEEEVGKQGFKVLASLATSVINSKGLPIMDVVVAFNDMETRRTARYPKNRR